MPPSLSAFPGTDTRPLRSDGATQLFEGLYAEPARLKEFLKAMTGLSRPANAAIAQRFPWNRYKTFEIGRRNTAVRRALCRAGTLERIPEGNDGTEPACQCRHRSALSLEQIQDL